MKNDVFFFVLGTRPEVIKMFPVINEMRSRNLKCIICSTGQHRQMLDQAFDDFNLTPDYELNVMSPNQTLSQLTSNLINSIYPLINQINPKCVLVQGDTTTAFVGALCAFYNKTKVAYIEAGLRSFDKYFPFPEEVNRKIVTSIADLHFIPTEYAKQNLVKENISPDKMFITGNTIVDALKWIDKELQAKGQNLLPKEILKWQQEQRQIILVTCHRRENFGQELKQVCKAVQRITQENHNCRIVFPVHLNPNVSEIVNLMLKDSPNIILLPPLSYKALISVMRISFLILSDSGGIQEEAPSFNVPLLVLRKNTERPEGVLAGCAKLVGTDEELIVKTVSELIKDKNKYDLMKNIKNPYGDGQAAKKIAEVLLND
jgi:UDP-N-acetylglucosamine 2-epimerase